MCDIKSGCAAGEDATDCIGIVEFKRSAGDERLGALDGEGLAAYTTAGATAGCVRVGDGLLAASAGEDGGSSGSVDIGEAKGVRCEVYRRASPSRSAFITRA